MNKTEYNIHLFTPLLCHGANPRNAELRVPSIRGLLRKWHTILWGQEDTDFCWGSVSDKKENPTVSKVMLRIATGELNCNQVNILPHKKERKTLSAGISANQDFTLQVLFRYLPEDNEEKEKIIKKVKNTIKIWLMLGTFGQRGTRAFGSVWDNSFDYQNIDAFYDDLRELLKNKKYAVWILQLKAANAIDISYCTDTIAGKPNLLGSIKPRRTSPLKMKYVKIGGRIFLLLHACTHEIIEKSLRLLQNKPIGRNFDIVKKFG